MEVFMPKFNREELKKYREELKKNKYNSSNNDSVILVGMGSCGIAAGARETLKAFNDEIEKLGLKNVIVKQTGCMGYCYVEPTVEIYTPGMPNILYVKVTPEVAKKILDHHIIHKRLVNEHILDKPAIDIMK